MPTFRVSMPVIAEGWVTLDVEATDKDEALDKFFDEANDDYANFDSFEWGDDCAAEITEISSEPSDD